LPRVICCAIPHSTLTLNPPAHLAPIPIRELIRMKYTVTVTQVKTYELTIDAIDEGAAIDSLDDWIEEDFEEYNIANSWTMEAK